MDVASPILEALVKKSFIRSDTQRYAVHELLRQYCAEMLSDNPQQYQQLCQRYANYYLLLLADNKESILVGLEALDVVQLIEDDLLNFHAAWFWAIENGAEFGMMLDAVKTLSSFIKIRGRINDAYRFYSDTLEEVNEEFIIQDSDGLALLSHINAELALNSYYVRDLETTRNATQRSVELAYQAESDSAIMFARIPECSLEFQKGNYEEGLNKLNTSYDLATKEGDFLSAAMILSNKARFYIDKAN